MFNFICSNIRSRNLMQRNAAFLKGILLLCPNTKKMLIPRLKENNAFFSAYLNKPAFFFAILSFMQILLEFCVDLSSKS